MTISDLSAAATLKPCPFCGSPMRFTRDPQTNKIGVVHDLNLSGQQDCHIYTLGSRYYKDAATAAAAWNTRSGAVVEAQGWRDISTAPKSGEMILVCLPRIMNLIVRARFNVVHGYWVTDYEGEGGVSRPHFFHEGDLWQPLPTPPTDTEDEG